jgi:predicted branched-subunit amino acid permease
VDPSFVVGSRRYADSPRSAAALRSSHAYYLAGAAVLWVGWLAALGVGAVAGSSVPAGLHLELLVPLYLLGQIMPNLRQATTLSGVVAAAGVAAPLHLGIAVGIVVGLVAGSLSAASLSTQEGRS